MNQATTFINPYIYGDSGLGKTHIVQSIGHEVRQRHPELQVLYVSMNKFQAQFQTAYKNGEIPISSISTKRCHHRRASRS